MLVMWLHLCLKFDRVAIFSTGQVYPFACMLVQSSVDSIELLCICNVKTCTNNNTCFLFLGEWDWAPGNSNKRLPLCTFTRGYFSSHRFHPLYVLALVYFYVQKIHDSKFILFFFWNITPALISFYYFIFLSSVVPFCYGFFSSKE